MPVAAYTAAAGHRAETISKTVLLPSQTREALMTRTIVEIQTVSEELPAKSERIAWAQFLELTGIHPSKLGELLEMEWIIPAKAADKHYLFTRRDVFRVRKLVRICDDFNLSATGGSIIVDLLERVEDLERKVEELESK